MPVVHASRHRRNWLAASIALMSASLAIALVDSTAAESPPSRPRFGSPLEISTETIDLTIQGTTFRLPANRLWSPLILSTQVAGELAEGFSIVGLWPDFAPRTKDNIDEFSYYGTGSKVIRVFVKRTCLQGSDQNCPSTARLLFGAQLDMRASFFFMFMQTYVAKSSVEGWGQLLIRRTNSGEIADAQRYVRMDQDDGIMLMNCKLPSVVPSPKCNMHFVFGESDLRIRVIFSSDLLYESTLVHHLVSQYLSSVTTTP
jgi:hypothetical protein